MKNAVKSVLVLLLSLCLLLAALPVVAARYAWVDGQVPEGWTRITDPTEITATDILAPINPNASQEAKNLYAYLCTLTDSEQFISGQFDIQNTDSIWERNKEQLGFEPGLYSNRYIVDTTMPTFDAENPTVITNTALEFSQVEEANALLKKHYDKGNVLLLHADSTYRDTCAKLLIQKGLYQDDADGIVELDACNPDRDMQTYALWVRYMDNVVDSLKALEALGVKAYMYRNLVEFNYNNFYGVTEEGYVAFTRVYQQMVQKLIDSGLTGFLSTYSPGHKWNTLNRYPGNEYVDVLSATLYSEWDLLGVADPSYGFPNYEWYVKTGKPFGFSEYSCRDGNVSENQSQARASWYTLLQETVTNWPRISWVNAWADNTFSMLNNAHMPEDGNDDGMAYANSPFVLNLDDLVDYRHTAMAAPGIAQFYPKGTEGYVGMEQRTYTEKELKALGVDLKKLTALRINEGYAVTFYANADCTGESWGYAESQTSIPAKMTAKFRSCEVSALKNVGLEAYVYDATDSDGVWKVNDGYSSIWETKVDDKTGTTWVVIELDEPANVAGYAVKTAGYGGRLSMYNLRDFQFQYSEDGENWVTLDTVTDNTASQVNRSVKPVVSKYFRLLITGANSVTIESEKNVVILSEWELLGVSVGSVVNDDGDVSQGPSDGSSEDDSGAEPEGDASQEYPKEDDSTGETEEDTESQEDVTSNEDTTDSSVSGEDTSDTDNDVGDEDTTEQTPETDGDGVTEDTDGEQTPDNEGDDFFTEEESDDTDGGKKKPIKIVTTEVYFPCWAWVLVGVGVLAVAGAVVLFVVLAKHKKAKQAQEA